MRKNQIIESSIASVLTGSRLPLGRRAEVAEELRDHLSQLVEEKSAAGMSEVNAVEAALADFGSLDEIRRQLRKQQGVLDRNQLFAKLHRFRWAMVIGCSVLAILLAIFVPRPVPVGMRCLFGVCVSIGYLGFALGFGIVAELLSYRIKRLRPRLEYSFHRSYCYWSAVVSSFLLTIFCFAPLAIIVCGFFGQFAILDSSMNLSPHLQEEAHWFLLRNLTIATADTPLRSFFLPLLTVLVCGMGIALYERSRCVDEDLVANASTVE